MLQRDQVVRALNRALPTRASVTATLQREHWNKPAHVLFPVSKSRDDKTLSAVCKQWTHAFEKRRQ